MSMRRHAPMTIKGDIKKQMKTLKRLLAYVLKNYKLSFLMVVICIVVSVIATLQGTLFLRELIDNYIVPILNGTGTFDDLALALVRVAGIYAIGIIASYTYNRIMVNVGQGTMKRLRLEMFSKMESLPIRYFDTHQHGDIMSIYTNDIDTLRQLISQSIPQLVNSFISVVSTYFSMIILDIPLTIVTLCFLGIMLYTMNKLSTKSGKYFIQQQKALGKVNGYIEEMMDGQKVVKVFCYEDKSLERFRELNEDLRASAEEANKIANITMPVNANLGNISYVVVALVGAILSLGGYSAITLGTLVSFLTVMK